MAYNESNEAITGKTHQELAEQEKNSYIQLCSQAIIKCIKDTTKDSSDVEIGTINVYAENLIPQIEYSFDSGYDFSVISDRRPSSGNHTLMADKNEMLLRMNFQQQNDFTNGDLRANIENNLSSNRYGEISDTTEVYQNPMMWLYHSKCDECNGVGSHHCPSCNGHGNTQCSRCGGTGQLRCEHCAGTGWLTTTGRTFIKAAPNYSIHYLNSSPEFFRSAVKKIGISKIQHYAALKGYDSYRTEKGTFTVRYLGRLIVAEAEVKIKGKTSKWILDLNDCRVSLLNPWGDERKKIANFISYDINRNIIKESLEDDDPGVIKRWVSNSVSERYIVNAMNALGDLIVKVRGINSWLFAILFAIFPGAIAYLISPVYVKLKPGSNVTFWNSLPLIVVSIIICFICTLPVSSMAASKKAAKKIEHYPPASSINATAIMPFIWH